MRESEIEREREREAVGMIYGGRGRGDWRLFFDSPFRASQTFPSMSLSISCPLLTIIRCVSGCCFQPDGRTRRRIPSSPGLVVERRGSIFPRLMRFYALGIRREERRAPMSRQTTVRAGVRPDPSLAHRHRPRGPTRPKRRLMI